MALSHRGSTFLGLPLLVLMTLLMGGCDDNQSPAAGLPTAELQQTLNTKVANSEAVPGALLAVAREGQSWIGVAGEADSATHSPMWPRLRFRIGSLTKQFTAALILKLVEEGKLSLDDTVRKWLPDLQLPNDDVITVRMLLNHTSGIPSFTDATFWNDMAFPEPQRAWQPRELIEIARTRQFTTPATVFSYCNTGYVLAGMIAEAAGGETASQAMARRFFIPLGMHDTELALDGTLTNPYVHGYLQLPGSATIDDVSTWNPSYAWTAGSIVSSAQDMLRWAEALFGGRVLSPSSLDAMCTPVPPSTVYGLGLGLKQVADGRTLMYHSGQIPGYYSAIAHDRASGLTIFILTNREDISQDSNDVLDPLFDEAVSLLP